jgi:hypothetical protein
MHGVCPFGQVGNQAAPKVGISQIGNPAEESRPQVAFDSSPEEFLDSGDPKIEH